MFNVNRIETVVHVTRIHAQLSSLSLSFGRSHASSMFCVCVKEMIDTVQMMTVMGIARDWERERRHLNRNKDYNIFLAVVVFFFFCLN